MNPQDQRFPPPSEAPDSRKLDSWKEIAGYLKRDIRTVQLWEKREGLPVHRHNHSVRASVYGYTNEIDEWQKRRRGRATLRTLVQEAVGEAEAAEPEREKSEPASGHAEAAPKIGTKWGWYVAGGIAAAALLAFAGWLIEKQPRAWGGGSGRGETLAVLPFEDISAVPSEAYVADGLTDDLVTELGRSGRLQVISRTSVMRFKGEREPLPRIAETLKADLVLEGTVLYAGKEARITAKLVDARSDQQIWANSYEQGVDSPEAMIALQDKIAEDITAGVLAKLAGGEKREAAATRPVDPSVRLAYLRGRFFWNKRDEAGLKRALGYFNEAIAKDPGYAPAYAGIADCYNLLSVWGSLPENGSFPKAKAAALRALELDGESAEAYTSLAFATYRGEWDFAAAERYFQKAIELNPNYATAHQWYGEFLGDLRRPEQSVAESRKAEELDPLSTIVGSDLADSYLHAGRNRDAIQELQRILTMEPNFVPAHRYLAGVYQLTGQTELAQAERDKYVQLSGDNGAFEVERIRRVFTAGKKNEARREAEALLKAPGNSPASLFYMAQVYVTVGDRDKAFECLENVYRLHSWWLVGLLVDPDLAPLRSDPRMANLAKRVGLPAG